MTTFHPQERLKFLGVESGLPPQYFGQTVIYRCALYPLPLIY